MNVDDLPEWLCPELWFGSLCVLVFLWPIFGRRKSKVDADIDKQVDDFFSVEASDVVASDNPRRRRWRIYKTGNKHRTKWIKA